MSALTDAERARRHAAVTQCDAPVTVDIGRLRWDLKVFVQWCDMHDRHGYKLRKDVLAAQFEAFAHSVRALALENIGRLEVRS